MGRLLGSAELAGRHGAAELVSIPSLMGRLLGL